MPYSKNGNWLIIFVLACLISGCNGDKPITQAPPLPDATRIPTQQISPEIIAEESRQGTITPLMQDYAIPECLRGHKWESTKVIRVIDGDTIGVELNGELEKVRYLMVDTPEMNANDPTPGKLAKEFNIQMVEGKTVLLVSDTTNRDDFGRLLRFVIIDGVSVNYELVEKGFATSFIRPSDNLCSKEYIQAMLDAFRARIGIWQSVQEIVNTSGNRCSEGCLQPVPGCEIKGNISSPGDKIYHLPGSKDYKAVIISTGKGERWFCTIDEAIANGWRPARAE